MESRGLNQTETANFIGVSPSLVSAMLIGKSPVTAKVLRKIEAASTRVSGGIGKTVTESNTPLGHIPVEGRDWTVQIPFYADAHTSALARDAALAVINSFDGAASHAAERLADQAATSLARMPMEPPPIAAGSQPI